MQGESAFLLNLVLEPFIGRPMNGRCLVGRGVVAGQEPEAPTRHLTSSPFLHGSPCSSAGMKHWIIHRLTQGGLRLLAGLWHT